MKNIDINQIIERLKENEARAKKFFEVETKILSILNFVDFFEVLLSEIKKKFGIPYVWISLIESSEVSNLIKSLGTSPILKERMNIINKDFLLNFFLNNTEPVLANNDLKPYFKLFPIDKKYYVQSIAVAPIAVNQEIIGSLNMADFSRIRFQPGIDTSLLKQLAVKASLCLSNVTAHEKLKFLAYHDPLTGLLNRRVMETVLKREFDRARRYETVLSVVFIDVNNFKYINDTYGHDGGDQLLKYVAGQLTDSCRKPDIVTRYAGDEFVIILPETSAKDAENLLKRIKMHFLKCPLSLQDKFIPTSISYGVASTEDINLKTPALILKKADINLYNAKNMQKNSNKNNCMKNIIRLPVA